MARLASVSGLAWAAEVASKMPEQVLGGEAYSFARKDVEGIWWARKVLVAHPDGRSALLSLVPRQDGTWAVIKKA
jgi:hypothetical protein